MHGCSNGRNRLKAIVNEFRRGADISTFSFNQARFCANGFSKTKAPKRLMSEMLFGWLVDN